MTEDAYHTMDELYYYRMLYNAMLFNEWAASDWVYPVVTRSWKHSDGELCFGGGWFIVTADLGKGIGQISNHYSEEYWGLFNFVDEVETAPEWDGHTPKEAAERMLHYIKEQYDV